MRRQPPGQLSRRSLEREIHPRHAGGDIFLVKNAALAAAIACLLLTLMLVGFTSRNEGCLPWQERVGYGDGPFGEGEDVSRCYGSRLPFH